MKKLVVMTLLSIISSAAFTGEIHFVRNEWGQIQVNDLTHMEDEIIFKVNKSVGTVILFHKPNSYYNPESSVCPKTLSDNSNITEEFRALNNNMSEVLYLGNQAHEEFKTTIFDYGGGIHMIKACFYQNQRDGSPAVLVNDELEAITEIEGD